MQNVVFTQLSITELRKLIREEQTEAIKEVFNELITDKIYTTNSINERYLSRKEAAMIASVFPSTIDTWIGEGHFKKYKLGESIRIKQSELLTYLDSLAD